MPANQEKTSSGTPQGVQDPLRNTAQEESVKDRPETKESPKTGGKIVKVMWPNNNFVVEGLPVMTREGTRVAVADLEKARKMADLCGVELEVED